MSTPAPRVIGSKTRREGRAGWAFTLPFLIAFVAMIIVPMVYSGWLSTFRFQLVGGLSFVGVDNYVRAVADPAIWRGLGNIATFLLVAVPAQMAISLLLALLLDAKLVRGGRIARLLIFVPYAVPVVVGTMMWSYLYGTDTGLIAQILQGLGLPSPNLLSSQWIMASIVNITGWEFIGYNMIIFYSALKTVPVELYEAAALDGAGFWRTAWSVKIPSIRGALMLVAIFSIIFSFQLFNEPSLLAKIAPAAVGQGFTPNLYAYNVAFLYQDMNYAAAIAFIIGVLTIVPSVLALRLFNRGSDQS